MTPWEPDRAPAEPQASPAATPLDTDSPSSRAADPFPELVPRHHKPIASLVLAGIVLIFAAVGLFKLFSPHLFGQANRSEPQPQATQQARPTVTSRTPLETPSAPEPASSPDPGALDALLDQAMDLIYRSEFEEAITICQKLVQQAPEDARPQIAWARTLLLDGEADQALSHALQAVALDPINAEAMATLAQAYAATGDQVRALGMAHNAVQLDASSAEAQAALAEVYLLDGQWQEALATAELALALDGNDLAAHRVRAQLYQHLDNDLARAIGELKIAADLKPELWLGHYELGMALLQAQDYEAAVVTLKTALGLRRKAMTYTAIGEAYYGLEQYDRAQAFLQQALSAGAADANTYALLAAIDAQLGRCDDARVFFELALAQDATNSRALQARDTCQGSISAAALPATRPAPSATPVQPAPTASPPPLSGWLAFPVWNSETNQYDTYLARPDGSERCLVATAMHQPAFRPDGQWLAVNGERPDYLNLSLVRPDGSELREITAHSEDGLPCWSPDGQSLTFSSTRHGDRQSRLYVIEQVPFDGNKTGDRTLLTMANEVLGQYPTWTDNNQIIYSGCDYVSTPVECGLFAIAAEAGPQTPRLLTTQAEDTAPAAFGNRISFMSNRDGDWEIWAVNEDGSDLRRLTDNDVNDGLPTWSPDGRTIAFVSDQGGVWAVWAMSPDGSQRRKLFDIGGGGLAPDWQQERIAWGP